MNKHILRVVGASLDTRQLTLYHEDGTTTVILQGDPRIFPIVQQITPILAVPGAIAEVTLEPEVNNPYHQFEQQFGQKTGIRFFQVAKAKLASWFKRTAEKEPESPPLGTLGQIPGAPSSQMELPKADDPEWNKLHNAVNEILAHAKPSSHPEFTDKGTDESTVVAVVDNQIVSDIHKLKPQIHRALKANSEKGLQSFLERLAAVVKDRRHSSDDLMRFMEKGDLPIADDGSIVGYKILKVKDGKFVDCHTEKVPQQVGSYVCMHSSLVDWNRNVECSNGLHVARRQFLRSFSGDVCVLVKIRPEDVITVPVYDPNKMRVRGYHILFELSKEDFSKLKRNEPFTDSADAQWILGRALAGDHPPPKEEVRITQPMGQGVVITPMLEAPTLEHSPSEPQIKETKSAEALSTEGSEGVQAPSVSPKAVAEGMIKAKAEIESRAQKAQRLYAELQKAKTKEIQQQLAAELMDHKKTTKLGWTALGLNPTIVDELNKHLG